MEGVMCKLARVSLVNIVILIFKVNIMLQVPTYVFRFNIFLLLTSHKPCGLCTGKELEG